MVGYNTVRATMSRWLFDSLRPSSQSFPTVNENHIASAENDIVSDRFLPKRNEYDRTGHPCNKDPVDEWDVLLL